MGNHAGKRETISQQKSDLDEVFHKISANKEFILKSDLQKTWGCQVDKSLYLNFEVYLFSENRHKLSMYSFEKFYYDICKEGIETNVQTIATVLNIKDIIPEEKMLQFVISVLNSILIIQEQKSPKHFLSWMNRISVKDKPFSFNEYAKYFLNKLSDEEKLNYTRQDLLRLLNYIGNYVRMIIARLYDIEEKDFYKSILPKWEYESLDKTKSLEDISILNLPYIMFLNSYLPCDFQSKWRILFSTKTHGESFARLTCEIVNKGPSILIVVDKNDYTFGGFASKSWAFGPTFHGDSRSFLFSLHPKMDVYLPSNFNENFQYLNVGQQTMPNGLGFGGRLEYFAMWLSAEFGTGYCSETCTTYRNYSSMSCTKEFEVKHLEVWGVGPVLCSSESSSERKTILNSDLEAKALFKMSGREAYSEGFGDDDP